MKLELQDLYAWSPVDTQQINLNAVLVQAETRFIQPTFTSITITKGEPAETVAAKLRLLAEVIDKIVENQE